MNTCRHLAIIMDGNGRWAKAQGKPRTAGHFAGADNVRTIAIAANERGVEYLTIYAFSTENWKRSQEEVGYLMKLPSIFFKKYMQEFLDRGFRIRIIGEMDALPEGTRNVLRDAEIQSEKNTGLTLSIAMNTEADGRSLWQRGNMRRMSRTESGQTIWRKASSIPICLLRTCRRWT